MKLTVHCYMVWGVGLFWVKFCVAKSLFRMFEAVSAIFFLDKFWPPSDPSQPTRMDKSINYFHFFFETFPNLLWQNAVMLRNSIFRCGKSETDTTINNPNRFEVMTG